MSYFWLLSVQTILILFFNVDNGYARQNQELKEQLLKYNFTQDGVLQNIPEKILNVTYGDIQLRPGDVLEDLQTLAPPNLAWDCSMLRQYTLAFFDPDVILVGATPEKPFLHWLVTNISNCDVSTGTILAAYIPPATAPPPVYHRYTFVMWRQRGRILSSLLGSVITETVGRLAFSVAETSKKLGSDPMFANFFQGVLLPLPTDKSHKN